MRFSSRALLLVSGFLTVGLATFVYATSPDVVPVHFGLQGPDRWGDPLVPFLSIAGMALASTALFLVLPTLVRRGPAALLNLPHRDYWLAPRHRDEAAAKVGVWSHLYGAALNLFTALIQIVTAPAHLDLSGSTAATLLLALTLGFLVYSSISVFWLLRAFRLPTERH